MGFFCLKGYFCQYFGASTILFTVICDFDQIPEYTPDFGGLTTTMGDKYNQGGGGVESGLEKELSDVDLSFNLRCMTSRLT